MSSTEAAAVAILKTTPYFKNVSDDLVQKLAAKLEFKEAPEGTIFVEEGMPQNEMIVLEEGALVRTKFTVADNVPSPAPGSRGGQNKLRRSRRDLTESMRGLAPSEVKDLIAKETVTVDVVEGKGRVVGLLHSIHEGGVAYATVSASNGPVKVWIMKGDDFRSILASDTAYLFDLLHAMATEVRSGTKSLRTLMKDLRSGKVGSDDDDKQTLRVLCYDTTSWVSDAFAPACKAFNEGQGEDGFEMVIDFTTERLGPNTATYAAGYDAICTFVNDTADAETMQSLSRLGVKMIAQRAAGFDRIDTKAARAYGMTVARVPAYSPYAVAEMGIALLMAVNRKTSKASNRVRMANFTLDAGLMGMDIHGKTVGVMGTGKIGQILCSIIAGFGAKLICYDVFQNDAVKALGGTYVTQDEIYAQSDVLFLMMPLLPATKHTINEGMLSKLKKGVVLINTSRGGLVDTKALLKGLRTGIIAGVGMDVYENEQKYFFQDWSARQIQDPDLTALLGEPNVVMTAHQAFFTKEAVDKITSTTIENLRDFKLGKTGFNHPNNCVPLE